MANPKFFAEFADEAGEEWLINIIDTTFTGGPPSELKLASDGFTLKYNGNNQDKFQPIIGSSVSFVVYNRSSGFDNFLNTTIPGSEEGQFLVEIIHDPDGAADLWWRGVLLSDQIEQLDEPALRDPRLTSDGE